MIDPLRRACWDIAVSTLDERPRSRVGLLAPRDRLRDLVLYAAARDGGPALLVDVHPDDALQGAVLVVDAERGFERPARLALINAMRTPMPRLAVVLVYCEPVDQELLSIVEQEVEQELALLGFSTRSPQLAVFRVVNTSHSLHSQLVPASAAALFSDQEFDDHWDDLDVACLTAALRAWAAANGLPTAEDDDSTGYPIDLLEPVIEALGLEPPIGERSGGPIRTQSGGWRGHCHCKREFHLLLQTQAFTGDYTTILWGCPDHPEDADLFTMRL